jgi:transcriptional regulator with XRE-family HTH domain
MTDEISFADWLTDQMRKQHLTQKQLADKAALGKSTINKLVKRMIMRPDARTYVAIAKALDKSPITVLRIAGILPPEPEIPELDDYREVLSRMSPKTREIGLEMMRALAERDK